MKGTERTIYVYDLVVKSRAAHAPIPSMTELAAVLKDRFQVGACLHSLEKDSLNFRFGDIKVDLQSNVLTVLIRRIDKNVADAVYAKMDTGASRVVPKQDDEGGGTAAHLAISLLQEANKPGMYLCMLEGIPGISHRPVTLLINAIIRLACQQNRSLFQYDDPSGAQTRDRQPKKKTFVPRIEMLGHLSDDLANDIANGTIQGIELVKSQLNSPLGGSQFLVEDQYSLKLKVSKNLPRANKLQRIVSDIMTNKAQFQHGRISFKNVHGKMRSITYDLNTGALEQQKNVKSFLIEKIDPPLAQSSDTIIDRLSSPMMDELLLQRRP